MFFKEAHMSQDKVSVRIIPSLLFCAVVFGIGIGSSLDVHPVIRALLAITALVWSSIELGRTFTQNQDKTN
jgi:hypothetical protein